MTKEEIAALIKARKGTPQYEAWLEKYRAKRSSKVDQPSLFGDKDPGKNKVTQKDLLSKPPKFVKDKEIWKKAVNKITNNGEKPGTYGACVFLYKRKLAKKEEEEKAESKKPAQLREDNIPWEKAVSDICALWEQKFGTKRLSKAKKGILQFKSWLEKYKAKKAQN